MTMISDNFDWLQILHQLHDKNIISTRCLCEELGLDYDEEKKKIRNREE